MIAPIRAGETVLLVDHKGRRYLVRLTEGATFHYHRGFVAHAALIGQEEGARVTSSAGGELVLLRPRLADYILKMRRGAAVVYPKDIGPILMWGDIRPGRLVLEAGTGSGALTIALVQAVGESGSVVSIERRADHAAHARTIIERWFGTLPPNLDLRVGEVEPCVEEVRPDRLVLDVPEPWHSVAPAARHLRPGALVCSYLPTVPQVERLVAEMRASGAFGEIECSETLHRTWSIDGRSVRPDHRMVGHTGFIVVARRHQPQF